MKLYIMCNSKVLFFSNKNIQQILEGCAHGPSIISSLEQNHNLFLEDRRKMVRILVSHLMEKFGE